MTGRVYFVADVHLGLKSGDPREREDRLVSFIKDLPREGTLALCLLGDIWDFWYEYRDVVPREGARVVAALVSLMDDGVEVWFCPGNHDVWTFSFFESLGMKRFDQPSLIELDGVRLCLGHGDALGRMKTGTRIVTAVFHSRLAQALFSTLHPWLAFRFGLSWSEANRKKHRRMELKRGRYRFHGESEPLFAWCDEYSRLHPVDCFIFGHFHDSYDGRLPNGSRLVLLDSWLEGGTPCVVCEAGTITSRR